MKEEFLKQLTDKIGDNASALFQLAIKQNYYYAIWDITIAIILVSGIIAMWKYWNVNDDEHDEYGFQPLTVKIVITVVVGFIAIMTLFAFGYRLVNPQYQAFTDLMGSINNGKPN